VLRPLIDRQLRGLQCIELGFHRESTGQPWMAHVSARSAGGSEEHGDAELTNPMNASPTDSF
jgi:hypothetical protein